MNRVLTKNLYKALKQVKRTTVHALPILNHILLEFREGELHLTTTDLENQLTARCPSIMNEEWSTCVPLIVKKEVVKGYTYGGGAIFGKITTYPFVDYIKVMSEQIDVLELEFIPETQTLVITAGRSRTEFKCLDAQEFPPVKAEAVA